MGFKSGYTYLARDTRKSLWYLVQQVSMKKWRATNFTHLNVGMEDNFIDGNGVSLWDELEVDGLSFEDFRRYHGGAYKEFRYQMFSILDTGKFSNTVH